MTSPSAIPPDDPSRRLTIADPNDAGLRHVSVAGGTYTILLSGAETAGRYCLIDMLVPDGGGPPPHRHDFEEMFTLLDGELEFAFRGETQTVRAGSTVNIPANAPHAFKNRSGKTARMLCLRAPAGQEELFLAIGLPEKVIVTPRCTEQQWGELPTGLASTLFTGPRKSAPRRARRRGRTVCV